ncbi:Hypothetical protein R9X50_00593900 [Acrodontium crateriforme]|uniref:Protein BIG1 n=1 Tax=Acrodontium crateriforme TaxID=150365 RepID=A0AAQ3M8X5_9PEZI|nr:Hypothetical protein R9X50_00593900 [Acrodontium crateriforme]
MLRQITTALLAATAVQGLNDASPFFALSSEPFKSNAFQSTQIATVQDVENGLINSLSDCSHAYYLFLSQPGLKAADFQHMPKLKQRIATRKNNTLIEVSTVVGEIDSEGVRGKISKMCKATEAVLDDEAWGHVDSATFMRPLTALANNQAQKTRIQIAKNTDEELDLNIQKIEAQGRPFLIVYTSPHHLIDEKLREPPPYAMDEPALSMPHSDLKRDEELYKRLIEERASNNASDNAQAGLPLFEKYQFLSPGIFMGLSVSLLLFSILYVGISAIAGLEVSYMAFSKEMGPQAQKSK